MRTSWSDHYAGSPNGPPAVAKSHVRHVGMGLTLIHRFGSRRFSVREAQYNPASTSPCVRRALLYNPRFRWQPKATAAELESVVGMLRATGVDASLVLTHSSAHAEEQARQAVLAGCDTSVLPAGGTEPSTPSYKRSPVPTLAWRSCQWEQPCPGARPAHSHESRSGGARGLEWRSTQGGSRHINIFDAAEILARFFVVAAVWASMPICSNKLNPDVKQRLGMAAYYREAWHLWLDYPCPLVADYVETGSAEQKQASLTELLGVRISPLRGRAAGVSPGAFTRSDDVRLILCHTASRFWPILAT